MWIPVQDVLLLYSLLLYLSIPGCEEVTSCVDSCTGSVVVVLTDLSIPSEITRLLKIVHLFNP